MFKNLLSWKMYRLFSAELAFLLVIISRSDQQKTGEKEEKIVHRPMFLPSNDNTTVGPGDRAVLKCRVSNLGTKTVTWRREAEPYPLTIGLFTFVGDTRISVDHNRRTDEWSLIIQDVRPTDEGVYQCQISTTGEEVNSYNFLLNVKTVQVSGTDYVERGTQIQLVCNATGKPDPPHDVQWYKNGQQIVSDAKRGVLITKKIETRVLISVLVLRRSEMKDDGYYFCRSSNGDHGRIKVHVLNDQLFKDSMRQRASDQDMTVQHIQTHNSQPPFLAKCFNVYIHLLLTSFVVRWNNLCS